jgi:hypothetical protein
VARLSGAARTKVATVRHRGKYFFVAPKKLGGIQKVAADSLTDCMNWSVAELGRHLARERKKRI